MLLLMSYAARIRRSLYPYERELKDVLESVLLQGEVTKQRMYQAEAIARKILELEEKTFPELATKDLEEITKKISVMEEDIPKTIFLKTDQQLERGKIRISPYMAVIAGAMAERLEEVKDAVRENREIDVIYRPSLKLGRRPFYTKEFTAEVTPNLIYAIQMNENDFTSIHGSREKYIHGERNGSPYVILPFHLKYLPERTAGEEKVGEERQP